MYVYSYFKVSLKLISMILKKVLLIIDIILHKLHFSLQHPSTFTITTAIITPCHCDTLPQNYNKLGYWNICHWQIQGMLLVHTPQQDQFLLFLHMFSPKSVCFGGWHPPMGQHPPTGNPGSATVCGHCIQLKYLLDIWIILYSETENEFLHKHTKILVMYSGWIS